METPDAGDGDEDEVDVPDGAPTRYSSSCSR